MTKENKWLQWVIGFSAILLLIGSFTWFSPVAVNIPAPVNQLVNLTDVESDIADLKVTLDSVDEEINKNNVWEEQAINLATAEWSKKEYKAIYNALTDIDDKEDIDKVVIKDVEVTNLDEKDKDATITQELKVYYEDLNGNDVKDYITVITYIEDGEVEEQTIDLS